MSVAGLKVEMPMNTAVGRAVGTDSGAWASRSARWGTGGVAPIVLVCLFACVVAVGCATVGPGGGALRLSDLSDEGDPQRRASLRLVLVGLDSDVRGQSSRALSDYKRALQVDASNPYAFLALTRHHVEAGEPERALSTLDRARTLLEADALDSPRVEAHLLGLRGAALKQAGRVAEGERLLDEAARRAPDVWLDGRLDADELR